MLCRNPVHCSNSLIGKLVSVESETLAGDYECHEYFVVRQNYKLYGVPVSGLIADTQLETLTDAMVLYSREDDDAALARAVDLLEFAGSANAAFDDHSDLCRQEARRLGNMILDVLQTKDQIEREELEAQASQDQPAAAPAAPSPNVRVSFITPAGVSRRVLTPDQLAELVSSLGQAKPYALADFAESLI